MGQYDVTEESQKLLTNLQNSRNAIIGRGGEISATAGFDDVPLAISSLPTSDASLSFYQDDTEAYIKAIPRGAQTYSNLISVGGKTRKVPGANLFTNASEGGIKWSIGVNQQEQYFSDLLQAGSYRLYLNAESEFIDDVVFWGYGALLNDSGMSSEGTFINSGEFFTITEPKYIVPWVGANESGTPADITVTQVGGNDDTPIVLGETKTVWIGGGSFCDIKIDTNTRVKVTVSHQFETQSDTEFIVGKGNYTYEWRNTSDSDTSVTIKVEQYSYADIEVTLYPMVYAVPNASDEHILTEYQPYFENLVPTAVTEIVSKGANLIPYPYASSGTTTSGVTFTVQNDGSILVNGTATANISWMLKNTSKPFSLEKGQKYTLSGSPSSKIGLVVQDTPNYKQWVESRGKGFTFTANYETYYMYISISSGVTIDNEIVKPMLNLGNSPATYRPYWSETVAIPDAVKNDASWGNSYNDDVNTYNFTEKAYTQAVNFIELDGVTEGKKFNGTLMMGTVRRMSISSLPKIRNSHTTDESVDFNITYFTPLAQYQVGKAHFYVGVTKSTFICCIPPEYDTVAKGNAWLAEMKANGTPIRLVYPLAEPAITTIGSDIPKPFFFKTEAEGEIVFENTDKEAVPSSVKYLIDIGEAQL